MRIECYLFPTRKDEGLLYTQDIEESKECNYNELGSTFHRKEVYMDP